MLQLCGIRGHFRKPAGEIERELDAVQAGVGPHELVQFVHQRIQVDREMVVCNGLGPVIRVRQQRRWRRAGTL